MTSVASNDLEVYRMSREVKIGDTWKLDYSPEVCVEPPPDFETRTLAFDSNSGLHLAFDSLENVSFTARPV